MREYIEREELIEICKNQGHADIDDVLSVSVADVIPVVHGRWIDKPTGQYGQNQTWCSVCGKHSGIGGKQQHKNYCPNCGAKMDAE